MKITRRKVIIINLIVLLACAYLGYDSKEYGYCVFIWICVAFIVNGMLVAENLDLKR